MKVKIKVCPICQADYKPYSSLQKTCSLIKCAIEFVKIKRKDKADKEFKNETKVKRKQSRQNDKSYQTKRAQYYCNRYIRERDKPKPCVSCGTTNDIQYCAGHYKSRGARPDLAFNEYNIHKQCNKRCNLELSGNIENYRIELIKRIGHKHVEYLNTVSTYKLTISDIIKIKEYYKEKYNYEKSNN